MTLSETRKEEKGKKDEHTPKEQTKNSALQGGWVLAQILLPKYIF